MTPRVWDSWQYLSLGKSINSTKSSLECQTMNSNQSYNAVIMCHNACACLVIWSDVCLKDVRSNGPFHKADGSCYSPLDQKGAVQYQRNLEFQYPVASYFSFLFHWRCFFFQAHLASSLSVSDSFYTHARLCIYTQSVGHTYKSAQ